MTLQPEVEKAFAYPFEPPGHGFVFVAGRGLRIVADGSDPLDDAVVELDGRSMRAADALRALGAPAGGSERRTAVVGYGSNASPQRLVEKYGAGADQVIPVLRCRLSGHDVVYACHVAGYGSIPAGLYASPGTVALVSVAFLTEAQLEVMHASEGPSYRFERLAGRVEAAGLGRLEEAHAYITRHGVYGFAGAPVALAAVRAEGRRFAAREQHEMLADLCRHLGEGAHLHDFVQRVVADPEYRQALTRTMRARALAHP